MTSEKLTDLTDLIDFCFCRVDPKASKIIIYCSFLKSDQISFTFLGYLFDNFEKELEKLTKLGLVDVDTHKYIEIHEMIKLEIQKYLKRNRDKLNLGTNEEILIDIIKKLNKNIKYYGEQTDFEKETIGKDYFELEGVCNQINEEWEEFRCSLEDLITIYDKLAEFFSSYLNNYAKSLTYREKVYKMRKRLLGNVDHPDLVKSLNSLGEIYIKIGYKNREKDLERLAIHI